MSKKERPLPEPPGRRKFHQREDDTPILADRIAEAMAGGNLEEFMKREIPDSEEARTLVSMMMGMTGMLPPEGLKDAGSENSSESPGKKTEEASPAAEPPEDLQEAAHTGDMEKLVRLLKREHGKRGHEEADTDTGSGEPSSTPATIGREDLDTLIRIASDNGLSPDWIILRAVRLYIREYERTGRL